MAVRDGQTMALVPSGDYDVPLLFRSELYASVSVVTGLFYATAFGLKVNDELWTALTFVLGITLRLLAIRYKWEMPKFVFGEDRN